MKGGKMVKIQVKKLECKEGEKQFYELYGIETLKDIDGKDVTIPRLLARCDFQFLQERYELAQAQVDAINEFEAAEAEKAKLAEDKPIQ